MKPGELWHVLRVADHLQNRSRDEFIIAASVILILADTRKRYFTGSLFAPS